MLKNTIPIKRALLIITIVFCVSYSLLASFFSFQQLEKTIKDFLLRITMGIECEQKGTQTKGKNIWQFLNIIF